MAYNDCLFSNQEQVSVQDYNENFLPYFQRVINQLLQLKSGETSKISFNDVHSLVHRCDCSSHSERLVSDVRQTVNTCITVEFANTQVQDPIQFMTMFNVLSHQLLYAIEHVAVAFSYLNSSFVENKFNTNLLGLLYADFNECIVKPLLPRIRDSFAVVRLPFAINPAVISSVVWTLYMLDNGHVQLAPDIFSQHVPGLFPSMREEEIQTHIAETHQLQNRLFAEGYSTARTATKRPLEKDVLPDDCAQRFRRENSQRHSLR